MLAEQKIEKAINSCERALENIRDGELRKAIGDLDFVKDYAQSAIWCLINELEEEN